MFATAPSGAQQTSKLYIGGSAGLSRSPEVDMFGNSNDRSSVCDEFINPLYASVPGCTSPDRGAGDGWNVFFDPTWGAFGSAYVGYRLTPFIRAELENTVRVSNYGQRSPVLSAKGVNADKLSEELFLAEEWLGTVSTLGLFVNVHFDLKMIESRFFLPYAGIGIGLTDTKVDYGSVWSRSTDPNDIRTGRDLPNAEEIARNLAGVASSGHATMEDTNLAFQALLGAEYFVYERISFDIRARWMLANEFNGIIVWNPLRGHIPNIRRDGSEPTHGAMSSSDFSAFVLSFGMRYYF